MKRSKAIGIAVVLLVAGGAAVGFLRRGDGAGPHSYVTVPVKKETIRQSVSSTGTLQAVVTVQVGSQVSGSIAKLTADYNSKVSKGQVIAELDQAKFKAKVEETRANLLSANAALAKAQVSLEDAARTMKRTLELRKRELISQSELDAAQTAYDAMRSQVNVNAAQVEQAKAALNQASIDLGYTVIRSPVDGVVISRNVDVGQTVAASLQAPTLFTIANDLAKMEVHTDVDEADVGSIWEGQEVSFSVDAYPSRRFQGKVFQVRNAAKVIQNVVTYDAVVRIDNSELLLRPGMTANVRFLVSEKENVIVVPNLALRFKPPDEKDDIQDLMLREQRRRSPQPSNRKPRSGGAVRQGRPGRVYVFDGIGAKLVEVRLGITDGTKTEIQSGDLKESDALIVGLSRGPADGDKSAVASPFQSFGRPRAR